MNVVLNSPTALARSPRLRELRLSNVPSVCQRSRWGRYTPETAEPLGVSPPEAVDLFLIKKAQFKVGKQFGGKSGCQETLECARRTAGGECRTTRACMHARATLWCRSASRHAHHLFPSEQFDLQGPAPGRIDRGLYGRRRVRTHISIGCAELAIPAICRNLAVADVCDDLEVRLPAADEPQFWTSDAPRSALDNHSRGEQLKKLFRLADGDPRGCFKSSANDRGMACRHLPDDVVALPPKIRRPMVAAGVEQGNGLAGPWLWCQSAIRLVQVARGATPGQNEPVRGSRPLTWA